MIKASLIEKIFKSAFISRWNDYPRTLNLVELDKQAHKFIIAYFLASFEKDADLRYIIKGGIFEFLSRIVITDIRPDVFHQIQKTKKNELNELILAQLEKDIDDIEDGKFLCRFADFLQSKDHKKECLILKAAGYLATRWEFNLVYNASKFLSDIEELKTNVEAELEDYYELIGVRKIVMNKKLAKIIDLGGRLRFQKRWTQTPRVPETSVLGHMLIVAILSYFYSLEVKACDSRLIHNFFCALFHDLPESLTRDIISPVKYGINGIDEIINEYEMRLIDEKILPFVPENIKDDFAYILGIRKIENKFVKNEFENRIFTDGEAKFKDGSMNSANTDELNAIDGKAIKFCDKIAALFEAGISISYGIKSNELVKAYEGMNDFFENNKSIENVNFNEICKDFKEYLNL